MEDPAATSIPTQTLWSSVNSWFTSTVLFILLNLMIATILFTSNLPSTNHHPQQDNQQEQQEHDEQSKQNPPTRSPSILHRLKTFNFRPLSPENHTYHHNDYNNYNGYNDHYQEPIEVAATQYVFNEPILYQNFDFDEPNSGQPEEFRLNSGAGEFYENETSDTLLDFEQTHEEIGSDNGLEDEFQTLDDVYSKLKVAGHVKSDGEVPVVKKMKMRKSVSLPRQYDEEEEEIVEARRPETMRVRKTVPEYDDVEVDSRADDFINKFKKDLSLQRKESMMKKGMKK